MRRGARVALFAALFLGSGELALRAWARWGHRWTNPPRGAEAAAFERLLRPSAHPGVGLELRPELDVLFRGRPFRTNAAGFRDRPRARRKAPGTRRVVGVGDSVMMGWGVGQGEDYLSRLEESLRAHGRGVEALNFAVGGYNTAQEYFVLRDVALAYEPDLVVVGYVGNDFEGPSFRPPRGRFDSPSALLNLGVLAWRRLSGDLDPRETHDWRPFRRELGTAPADFEEALSSIAALCRERGIPAVLVLDSRYESPVMRHRDVEALARKLGFRTLDLMSRFRRLEPGTPVKEAASVRDRHNRELVIEGDRHPNEEWHRRTAALLADVVAPLIL